MNLTNNEAAALQDNICLQAQHISSVLEIMEHEHYVIDTNEDLDQFKSSGQSNLPPIGEYCYTVLELSELEGEVLVVSSILLNRFLTKVSNPLQLNLHKLIATIFFVSQKYLLGTDIWSIEDFSLMVASLKES